MKVTNSDLAGMLGRLARNAHRHHIIAEPQLALETGSKLYGNSYNVIVSEGGRYQPFGSFHFGFTKREAYNAMHAMCVALEMA